MTDDFPTRRAVLATSVFAAGGLLTLDESARAGAAQSHARMP